MQRHLQELAQSSHRAAEEGPQLSDTLPSVRASTPGLVLARTWFEAMKVLRRASSRTIIVLELFATLNSLQSHVKQLAQEVNLDVHVELGSLDGVQKWDVADPQTFEVLWQAVTAGLVDVLVAAVPPITWEPQESAATLKCQGPHQVFHNPFLKQEL